MVAERTVKWDRNALLQLKEACDYIKKDSLKNSLKVKKEIFRAAGSLANYPERYPLDKFKINNDGSFRCFILHRLRISYVVLTDEIIILRIRHTSMQNLDF